MRMGSKPALGFRPNTPLHETRQPARPRSGAPSSRLRLPRRERALELGERAAERATRAAVEPDGKVSRHRERLPGVEVRSELDQSALACTESPIGQLAS